MKKYLLSLGFCLAFNLSAFCQSGTGTTTASDTCCSGYTPKPDDPNGGFSLDRKLDIDGKIPLKTPGAAFLENRGLSDSTYVNDYTGSLGSPSAIFQEVDFSSYDLLAVNATFTDKNNIQKLVVAPFKIITSVDSRILSQLRINLAVKAGITTVGIGIGYDSSDPRRSKVQKMRQDVFSDGVFCIPECYTDKVDQEKARQRNKRNANNLQIQYNEKRTKHVLKYTLGYNSQLFSILSSSGSNNVINDANYYGLKANTVSFSASYGYNNSDILINAGYNYIKSRKSAEKEQDLLHYDGFQFSANYRLLRFINKEKIKENETYIKTNFVPALHFGLLYEYKGTDQIANVDFLEDGVRRSDVFTPFIDILISPAAQFRIGVPYTKNKSLITGSENVSQFGTVLQYAFKLVNLN